MYFWFKFYGYGCFEDDEVVGVEFEGYGWRSDVVVYGREGYGDEVEVVGEECGVCCGGGECWRRCVGEVGI